MPFFKPILNVNLVGLPSYRVADLISPIRTWNSFSLQDLFELFTVQNILSIHLPTCGSFDKWVWAPSSSGNFSVKSVLDISLSLWGKLPPLATEAWSSLWGLKIQGRLRHLLSKVAWDILPLRAKIGMWLVKIQLLGFALSAKALWRL